MERIGIAASKIAQGNLFLYNFFVVAIASLFSLLVFFVSGCAIVLMLVIVAYVSSPGGFPDLQKGWMMFKALLDYFYARTGLKHD